MSRLSRFSDCVSKFCKETGKPGPCADPNSKRQQRLKGLGAKTKAVPGDKSTVNFQSMAKDHLEKRGKLMDQLQKDNRERKQFPVGSAGHAANIEAAKKTTAEIAKINKEIDRLAYKAQEPARRAQEQKDQEDRFAKNAAAYYQANPHLKPKPKSRKKK